METKIQIKSINGDVLFEFKKENNTLKVTIEEALRNGISLQNADLSWVDLRGVIFCEANLSGVDFSWSNLRGAKLNGANLCGAIFCDADLRGVNFCRTRLCEAIFCNADLRGAIFRNLDLRGVDFHEAILYKANFCGAINVPYIPLNCPSEGSFIGWKEVNGKLIKLEIPEDAKRSSATTMKCRCNKAKVLAITALDGTNPISKIVNDNYCYTTYKVGEMVYPDSFDEDRWNECSNGIHFFINKQDAINYYNLL